MNRIRKLRYGPEGKDYFWIIDMHPRGIMHPYLPDLEGVDLSDYQDSNGTRPFVEFCQNRQSSYRRIPLTTCGNGKMIPIAWPPRFPM